jgi:hypothetical protein
MIIVLTKYKIIYMKEKIFMIKDLIYNYYYKKFMKENSKNEIDIDWNKLYRLDKMCEKYYK